MKSSDFASEYPRLAQLPSSEAQTAYADAIRWSSLFGGHLHQILSGDSPEPLQLDRYIEWIESDYSDMEQDLFYGRGSLDEIDHASRKISALSFHIFNSSMLPLWVTSHLSTETPKDSQLRRKAIVLAQGSLALRALNLYEYRDRLVKSGDFYSKELEPLQYSIQGRLVEFDAAIALLNHIKAKKPEYNLYAAPAQFEHGPHRRDNVDFILNNPVTDQTLGIQVKTTVRQDTYDEYDRNKIVLIDGAIDLGGERNMKIAGEKHARVRKWGGMVAVSHLISMSRQDKKIYADNVGMEEREFLSKVFKARSLLAGAKPYRYASSNVGNRIEQYFEQQKAA